MSTFLLSVQRDTCCDTDLSELDYRLLRQKSDREEQDRKERGADLHRFHGYLHYHLRSDNAPYDSADVTVRHENTRILQLSPLPEGNVTD